MKIKGYQEISIKLDQVEQKRVAIHTISEIFGLPDSSIYEIHRNDDAVPGGSKYFTKIVGEGERSMRCLNINDQQAAAAEVILAIKGSGRGSRHCAG